MLIGGATLVISSSMIDQGISSEQLLCVSSWVVLLSAIAFTLRNRSALAGFTLIATIFFVFSFGPGGNPHKHEPAFTPLGVLFSRVPGLAAVRAVGRYGAIVVFAAYIAAAIGIQRFISSERRHAVATPLTAVASLLIIFGLVENILTTIPFDAPAPPAQAFTTLSSDSSARGGGAVLILPFSSRPSDNKHDGWSKVALLNSRYALWESSSTHSPVRLVNGYSGQRSKVLMQLPRATQNFPDTTSLDYFARICGLRYIVVVPALFENWSDARFDQQLQENGEAFAAVQRFDDRSILLTLATREISATEGTLPPYFAPRHGAVRLQVSPRGEASCLVTATSLSKSEDGERVALQSSEYTVTREQIIAVAPPSQLLSASPHILELRIQGCSAGVRCEVDSGPH
jgi:hypothetical protein